MRRSAGLVVLALGLLVPAGVAEAGVVVFASDRCPDGDGKSACLMTLWQVTDTGADLQRLTPGSHAVPTEERSVESSPMWSPDGLSVIYRRRVMSGPYGESLWRVRADGSERAQVGPAAPNDRFPTYDEPDWSPDGRWIAFASRPADASGDGVIRAIWLMSADGGEIRRLTDGSQADGGPVFSPDGRRIAFTRQTGESERGLFTMDLDGGDVQPVFVGTPPGATATPWSRDSLRATWSPLGTQFAIAYTDQLYTVNSDGSGLQWRSRVDLPYANMAQLVWALEPSPALIFAQPMQSPAQPLNRLELVPAGSSPTPITPPPATGEEEWYVSGDQDPDWRPGVMLPRVPDADPPVVLPVVAGVSGPAVDGVAADGRLTVKRSRLRFAAVDPSGVSRVGVAVARRAHGSCRFLARDGFTRARSCSRPVWHPVGGERAFRKLVGRLRAGRYVMRLRGADAAGNRSKRGKLTRLRLRR